MASPNSKFEQMARDAAERIDASRDLQQQLTLLPDEAASGDQGETRRTRGTGRAMSQMRDWMASQGLRLPEEVLAELAGLDDRDHALVSTMRQAEQVLAWAQDGAVGAKGNPAVQTMSARLNMFSQLWAMRLRAADALMPYGAPKATPDVQQTNVTQIVVAGGQPAPTVHRVDQARDVTPGARRIGPPPMPHQIEQYQQIGGTTPDAAMAERRTQDGER